MNLRLCAVAALTCLIVCGCRHRDPSVDLLESELRYLEDQLYILEDDYEFQKAQLASCRRENTTLRKELANGSSSSSDLPRIDGVPSPAIEGVPEAGIHSTHSDETSATTSNDTTNVLSSTSANTVDADGQVDPHVTHIALNQHLTGGRDFDGQPGDEGVQVVIQPRNAKGQYVPLAGPVSVVVLDPTKSGAEARVARWDFESTETAALMRKTLFGNGIQMELPWPNEPPENSRLQLYVRYVTLDGQKLDIDKEIAVDLPGQISNRWTPATDATCTARSPQPSPRLRTVAPVETPIGTGVRPASRTIPASSPADLSPAGAASGTTTERPAEPREATRRPEWSPYR